MAGTGLYSYYLFVKTNIKHFFMPHLLLSILLLIVTFLLFGLKNLDAQTVAMPLEMLVSLIGIVLLTPVFAPEEKEELTDLMLTKAVSYSAIINIRLLYSMVSLIGVIGAFVVYLRLQHSDVSMLHFLGTCASAVLLGGIGFCAAALLRQVIAGYMAALLFYLLNFVFGKKLGGFYIFQMAQGSYDDKIWQAGVGLLLIVATLYLNTKGKGR